VAWFAMIDMTREGNSFSELHRYSRVAEEPREG
jgi:hypothetical protein